MKKLLAVALLATLAGCSTQVYEIQPSNGEKDPTYDRYQNFFVSGIGQEEQIDASQICGGADKVVKVETKQTFLNGLVGSISYGIYTPRNIKVYCK